MGEECSRKRVLFPCGKRNMLSATGDFGVLKIVICD